MAETKQQTTSTGRQWTLRIAAILFGLLLLLGLEGTLRAFDIGKLEDSGDPFVGFSDVIPLFEPNEEGTIYTTSPKRQVFFRPDAFRVEKPDKEFRIFCFGGSTVQGRPYAIETSFTTWLELSLKAADDTRDWRVVNCGGVSYASYRLIPILKETLDYEPDLFVIYTGHNEFLEDRSYDDIKQQPPWLRAVSERVVGWRIYGLMKRWLNPATPAPTKDELPTEVEALLDYQGGLAQYHRDDDWHRGVVEHYELNLRRMIRLARSRGVPVILANPISDIRDTVPFKAENSDGLSAEELERFSKAWEEAKQMSWDDLDAKLVAVKEVVALDPRYSEAQYLLAKVLDSLGRFAEARTAYYRAKDEDICPLRMTEPMHVAVHRVAAQTGTPLVDVRKLFESKAKDGIPGDDELIDHVHPHIDGHQWIAELLFDNLRSAGIVEPTEGWQQRRDQLYKDNYVLLPETYFPFALSRLEGLNNWARGRVAKIRPQSDDADLDAPSEETDAEQLSTEDGSLTEQ